MSLSLHHAQKLHGISTDLLSAALDIDRIQKGEKSRHELNDSLFMLTTELSEWGLDSEAEFKKNTLSSYACHSILRARDGYEAWAKPGQTVEDVRQGVHAEYQNLLKILSYREDSDLGQAKEFCLLLCQWSGAEVMTEHQDHKRERHPLRRYVA